LDFLVRARGTGRLVLILLGTAGGRKRVAEGWEGLDSFQKKKIREIIGFREKGGLSEGKKLELE